MKHNTYSTKLKSGSVLPMMLVFSGGLAVMSLSLLAWAGEMPGQTGRMLAQYRARCVAESALTLAVHNVYNGAAADWGSGALVEIRLNDLDVGVDSADRAGLQIVNDNDPLTPNVRRFIACGFAERSESVGAVSTYCLQAKVNFSPVEIVEWKPLSDQSPFEGAVQENSWADLVLRDSDTLGTRNTTTFAVVERAILDPGAIQAGGSIRGR